MASHTKHMGADEGTGTNLEFWFEFASTYSYLSVMRIDGLTRAAGLRIAWRPFLLGPIFRSFGWSTSPFLLQKEKGAYAWIDMERQCRKFGLPWRRPTAFPRRCASSVAVRSRALLESAWAARSNSSAGSANRSSTSRTTDSDAIS